MDILDLWGSLLDVTMYSGCMLRRVVGCSQNYWLPCWRIGEFWGVWV